MPYYITFYVVKEDTHIVEQAMIPDVFYGLRYSRFPNLLLMSTLGSN